jgi:hypothetical protein
MIIKTLNVNDFRNEFADYGRGDQFSYEGLGALFNEVDNIAEESDSPFEMDVIALCCDYTEYTEDGLVDEYGHMIEDNEEYADSDVEEKAKAIAEVLENSTRVIKFDGGYIVQAF